MKRFERRHAAAPRIGDRDDGLRRAFATEGRDPDGNRETTPYAVADAGVKHKAAPHRLIGGDGSRVVEESERGGFGERAVLKLAAAADTQEHVRVRRRLRVRGES